MIDPHRALSRPHCRVSRLHRQADDGKARRRPSSHSGCWPGASSSSPPRRRNSPAGSARLHFQDGNGSCLVNISVREAGRGRSGPLHTVAKLSLEVLDWKDPAQVAEYVDGKCHATSADNVTWVETIDATLDGMPLAVVGLVELRRPTTPGPKLLAVSNTVGGDRDGRLDPTSAQVGPVTARVVRLVGPHPVGSPAGSPTPQPWHPDGLQDRFELRGVTPLPGRDQHRQGLLPLLDSEVDLGRQPASGASETVVGRFDGKGHRAAPFADPPFRRPGGVRVSPADGGIDVHIPRDQTLRIGLGLELGDDPRPRAIALPPSEQVVDPVPRAVPLGHITPGRTSSGPPPYAVYQLPPSPHRRTAGLMPCGNNGSSRAHWLFVRSPRLTKRDHPRPRSTFATDPSQFDRAPTLHMKQSPWPSPH